MGSQSVSNDRDQLIRATAADGKIRAVGLVSTTAVAEARRRHRLSYVATVALGRAMNAGLLLAANLKKRQSRISLQIRGDGPLGQIWVDAGQDGTVRGYVQNPAIELPLTEGYKLDVGQAVGRYGYMHVLRDDGFGIPHTSATELVSGEVGDDLTRYLANSEQTPSVVLLGVMINTQGVQAAGGVLLQLMPGAPPELIPEIEWRLSGVEEFTPWLAEGQDLATILQSLLGDLDLKILPSSTAIQFHCQCSAKRVKGALKILGVDELADMLVEDKGAEVTCHFCNEVYQISEIELGEVLEEVRASQQSFAPVQ